ncbi:MAG: hypothetical protein ACOYLQ_15860 [Hyphomicrobiaceae bacterium]|jgi:hypothetical protein
MADTPPPALIEVRVRELAQLFNSLDPSPFHERDLDDDAEAHIVGWARELPDAPALRIVVHLPPAEAEKARQRGLAAASANHFARRAAEEERNLRDLFWVGRRYLMVGAPLLIACLFASQLTRSTLGQGPVAQIIQESLIIVGWVANWKPIETFLYDWWPVRRRRDLFRRLQAADVVIEES